MKMIEVSGVSKRYRIGAQRLPYRTLRESIVDVLSFGRTRSEAFLALTDVTFDVEEGESLAIVGRNGAGKTTLLKILSRITPPSSGRILLRGRVASLLEVGTGFHPELTGRENIYLNGSILGLTRREINAKLDAIVEFSGVEKFLSTPIKRYSTGMQLRLAFAVAAHLDPEILIIDEVLAVGDAEFQKKCLGKMQEVSRGGRTVLFVSHNMAAVRTLCEKAILLEKGTISHSGDVDEVIDTYLKEIVKSDSGEVIYESPRGDDSVKLRRVTLRDHAGRVSAHIDVTRGATLEIEADVLRRDCNPIPAFRVLDTGGTVLLIAAHPDRHPSSGPGKYLFTAKLPANFFNEGSFTLAVTISTTEPLKVHHYDPSVLTFDVIDDLEAITRNGYRGKFPGYFRPLFEWSTEKLS